MKIGSEKYIWFLEKKLIYEYIQRERRENNHMNPLNCLNSNSACYYFDLTQLALYILNERRSYTNPSHH